MILKQFDLSGKVAIVTGSSTGLGAGMALGLFAPSAEPAAASDKPSFTAIPKTKAKTKPAGDLEPEPSA